MPNPDQMCQLLQSIALETKIKNCLLSVYFYFIIENLAKISRKCQIFFLAKFKIISSIFRVSRNFENAVSQSPYFLLTELAFFRQSRSQRGKALFHTTVLQYKQSRFHHFIYLFFHFHINSASGSGQKFWIHADPDPGLQH